MRIFSTLTSIALLIALSGCDELAAPPAPTPPTAHDDHDHDHDGHDHDGHDHDGHDHDGHDHGDAEHENAEHNEDVEREAAKVGVGKKGRNYGGGVVSEPIRAMFRTEQRLQLMQVDQAKQLYKATNGHFPKTHEIFMKEIIEANSIQLPELPEGERYVYDPEKSELMVERPKK